MRKKLILIPVLLLVLMLAVISSSGAAGPIVQATPDAAVQLQSFTFRPTAGEQPVIAPGLAISGYATGQQGYYIIQFAGPVQQAWKDEVTTAGAELLAYIPDFAFKVRMNPAQAARVQNLDSVAWTGLYQPAYKLSPTLLEGEDEQQLVKVRVERGADAGRATAAIVQSGAQIIRRDSQVLLVLASSTQLVDIANVLDVAWVEAFRFNEKHNESGAGVIMGANTANANGYDGSTQIAAVADTGLGDGSASGAHPDIPASRIAAIYNWTTGNARRCYRVYKDGAQDVDSGHGTHVSVSVLGDGDANGVGKGTAPAANLVFQAVEEYLDIYGACTDPNTPDGYYLIGLPDDLHDLYQQAYNAGARIHSNSWGSSQAGVYTIDSASSDDFIWDNPDMTITFSAGNEGVDANTVGADGIPDGVVDNDSTGSPATAKNVITVGASENERTDDYPCDTGPGYVSHDAYQPGVTCADMGGSNLLGTWGQRYGSSFTAEPLFSDVTAGNKEQMASWSSRGPTDDGRIKPDVVAPGTWILSGFSGLYQEGFGDPLNPQNGLYQWDGWGMPFSAAYKYMGGTSMSNPLAAGAATVVRDYYQKAHGHSASAALVKATLINSAVDMLDENNDGAGDNDFPIPNIHEGWGRINVANATDGSREFVDNGSGVNTGETAVYYYNVATGGSPLKVSLVWSDFASTEGASKNLVNDLDLTVSGPGGTYKGNDFSGGWAQSGGSADRVNNVENVYIQSAGAGVWTVTVSGYNIPQGPQPFALVVDADLGGTLDVPPTVTIMSPAEGAPVSGVEAIQIEATDAEDSAVSLNVSWNVDGGTWQTVAYNSESGYYEASWDTTEETDGSHTINARVVDSANNTSTDSSSVTVGNAPSTGMHLGDLDGTSSSGSRRRWNATVTILVEDDAGISVPNATVTGSWSAGANGSSTCVTGGTGQCDVSKSGINTKNSSVIFTVTGVSHASYTYQPGDNFNPDSDDSDGTYIRISAP